MPESGKSNKVVEIGGIKFQIDEDIKMPPKPGGNQKTIAEPFGRSKGKADRFGTHNYNGTFEVYFNAGFQDDNYERNGIYLIIE